jgi:cell wall-associated NlpC family hydrolase
VTYSNAEIIPQPKPLYQKTAAPKPQVARRGPSNLSSRGGYGLSGGGIQVLRGDEDVVQPAAQSTFNTAKTTANVVKVKAAGARIRRNADPKSQVLFVCPIGTELAVTGHKGYWYSVLMSDRSTGWLPAKYVDMLQKTVDTQTQVVTGSEAAKMFAGSGLQEVDGRYVSNNPFISTALTWMGTPYVYGGESRNGIDCSSFVQHVFRANGVSLPRTAAQQAKVGTPIAMTDLQTGDRLYFSSSRTYIDHTGIYIGNGKFIHASGSRRGVTISDLSESFYQRIYVGARR